MLGEGTHKLPARTINQWWFRKVILAPKMKTGFNLAISLHILFLWSTIHLIFAGTGAFSGPATYRHSQFQVLYETSGPINVRWKSLFNTGWEGLLWSQKHKVCRENAATGMLIFWLRVILKSAWEIILYGSTRTPSPERMSRYEEIHLTVA